MEGAVVKLVMYVDSVMAQVWESFEPDAVVCQCGADGLAGDPHAAFNLTEQAFVQCVQCLQAWKRPLLLTGGGQHSITVYLWGLTVASRAVTGAA